MHVRGVIERVMALLSAANIVAVPTGAIAQIAGAVRAPVAIKTCSVDTSYAPVNPFYGPAQQAPVGSIRLAFVNDNDPSALSVRFILTDGGHTQHVIFSGTFARSITIERTLQADANPGGNQNITCAVEYVHYADGSSWSAAIGRAGPS